MAGDFASSASPDDVDHQGITLENTPVPSDFHFSSIGIGKPLLITLECVYLGPGKGGKDVLVTSQVRNPLVYADAGLLAMNTVKYDAAEKSIVRVGVEAGSQVIYYAPSVADDRLSLSVKLKFDGFNREKMRRWVTAGAGIASLPAFIAGGALAGPVGAASSQAVVKAVGASAGLIVNIVDNLLDGKDMVELAFEINIDRSDLPKTKAGWILLYPESVEASGIPGQWGSGYTSTQRPASDSESLVVDGDEFLIGDDGTLRRKSAPNVPYKGDFPYALISVNGVLADKLKRWKPTAVTANLAARFLQQQSDDEITGEVSEAFEAFSDVLVLKEAKSVEAQWAKTTNASEKSKLKKKLDALIESIQDDDVRTAATRDSAK